MTGRKAGCQFRIGSNYSWTKYIVLSCNFELQANKFTKDNNNKNIQTKTKYHTDFAAVLLDAGLLFGVEAVLPLVSILGQPVVVDQPVHDTLVAGRCLFYGITPQPSGDLFLQFRSASLHRVGNFDVLESLLR